VLKRTPLYELEKDLGAKFTEFAGWELPLYYSSITEEHLAVRKTAGIFDISHLGKISIKGKEAYDFLQYIITADISKTLVGSGTYTLICNEQGGIIDDEIIYHTEKDSYLVIPNASQVTRVLDWFRKHAASQLYIKDLTSELCLIALQGPNSGSILEQAFDERPEIYKRYSIRTTEIEGDVLTIARSGYTGECGFEIFCRRETASIVWERILSIGAKPAGLGARDTLRLEMGYPLYSKDLSYDTSPIEAGLERFVSFEKGNFIGKAALYKQSLEGPKRKLVGLVIDKGIARQGKVMAIDREDEIGVVTSGSYSPILRKGIGMAYVKAMNARVGEAIRIKDGKKMYTGRIARRPFIKVSSSCLRGGC